MTGIHFSKEVADNPVSGNLGARGEWRRRFTLRSEGATLEIGNQLTLPLCPLPIRNSCCCPVWMAQGNCLTLS
jgi:hypothetical protein